MICLLVLLAALAASASGVDPVALPPADDYVPDACVRPIEDFYNHDKWVRLTDDLWFQANGARKAVEQRWRRISDPLQCVGASQCSVTVSHISSFAHSLSWGASASIGFDLWKKIKWQASAYVNMSTEHVTSSAVSYTCTAKENQTVYLAARVEYYEVFGYAAEMVRGESVSVVQGNATVPTAIWGWKVPCRLMMRSPKVGADGSIAGSRRCVVTNGTEAALQEEEDQTANDVPLVQLS